MQCGSRLLSRTMRFTGACLIIDYVCAMGHNDTWYSSPSHHHQYQLNVKLACITTLAGIRHSSMHHFMELFEMPGLSLPRFSALRSQWLFPVIYRVYTEQKNMMMDQLRSAANLVLCGDGQFDSPGYSAKYCTYSIMNSDTNKIVDFCVIQKGQFQGELEKQACEQLLNILVKEEKLTIESFVTDRHTAIGAMMNSYFSFILHAFDVWHMAKSLLKKLTACSKKHPKVGLWQRSIVNHFWWACKECKGDKILLIEMFHSCLLHVLNIHKWSNRRKIIAKLREYREKRPYPMQPVLMNL